MGKEYLLSRITGRNSSGLDDMVHTHHELSASALNNDGVESQIDYLLACGYVEDEVFKNTEGGKSLDDMVYEHYANAASNLNNEGPEAQVEFLLACGYTEGEILKVIDDGR